MLRLIGVEFNCERDTVVDGCRMLLFNCDLKPDMCPNPFSFISGKNTKECWLLNVGFLRNNCNDNVVTGVVNGEMGMPFNDSLLSLVVKEVV